MLLHLVCIHTLSNGSVTLTIVAVETRLYLAFFLLTSRASKSITKDILALNRWDIALVAWDTVLVSSILLLLATSCLRECGRLAIRPVRRGLVSRLSGPASTRLAAILPHLYTYLSFSYFT